MNAASCGHEPTSGLFYEVLGTRDTGSAPVLFIHGAGATGACWRATPDGRAGWADLLAGRGRECWLTDWPGTGRSGGRDALDIGFAELVEGYRILLRDVLGRPATVLCHSMGGAIAWQLVAREPALVAGVVSVAGAYPGNLAPRSAVLADDGTVLDVAFADTGVHFRVDRTRPYLYEDAYVRGQAVATSTRLLEGDLPRLKASFVGIPPRVLLQRLGVIDGLPGVDDPSGFADKKIRLLAGPEDPAHTHEIESRTVEQLRAWGADADLTWLPELGIDGNGHFMFHEDNSEELLDVVERLLGEVRG